MRIAISGAGFLGWAGGLDFLRTCLRALQRRQRRAELELLLLAPGDSGALFYGKRLLWQLYSANKGLWGWRNQRWDRFLEVAGGGRQGASTTALPIYYYRNQREAFRRLLQKLHVDLVLPLLQPLGENFCRPWIGYLYDFQHRHFPDFFSPPERQKRDEQFERILHECAAVVVNSRSVREDADIFFPAHRSRIFPLPFAAFPEEEWLEETKEDVRQKFRLPERYFLVANQFWVHKDHETAFRALALLQETAQCRDVAIVCTGETHDHRFPEYFARLRQKVAEWRLADKIFFLGFLPKLEQIRIMQYSRAILQPTLFEGGPGGGAVYDAVALGLPCLVSDIKVNRELSEEGVHFFKSSSAADLAEKMVLLLQKDRTRVSSQELLRRGHERLDNFAAELLAAAEFARSEFAQSSVKSKRS